MNTLAIWSPRPNAKHIEAISPNITLYGLPVIVIHSQPFDATALINAEALIFVSHHAVQNILEKASSEALADKTLIAIGQRTADALKESGLAVKLVASAPFNSESLLADNDFKQLTCNDFAIVCGEGGRTLLHDELTQRGKNVQRIECYQRYRANLLPQDMLQFMQKCTIAGIILSSGEITESVAYNLNKANFRQAFCLPVFVLSERIAQCAKQLGFSNIHIAEQASQYYLYQRIINWWEGELR